MFKCIFQIVLLVFVCQVHAEGLLPLYDGAEQIEQRSSLVENHHIALSKNKKIDGRWRFEHEQKLTGVLVKRLYEISTEDSYVDIARFYIEQISALKASVLFHCAERACGSSNEWANSMFRDRRMFGPDNKQYYWAIRDGRIFWAIYLVERGDKRVYLYMEHLQPANIADAAIQPLQVPCLSEQDLEPARKFASVKDGHYFLLYSVAGLNTARQSQAMAEDCVAKLGKEFPGIDWQALGMGEFERGEKARVLEDKIEIVRLQRSSL